MILEFFNYLVRLACNNLFMKIIDFLNTLYRLNCTLLRLYECIRI